MAKNRAPASKVKCCVCEKKIDIDQKRIFKKTNGSGYTVVSRARQLRDSSWVCSDVCFNLATQPPSDPFDLGPD